MGGKTVACGGMYCDAKPVGCEVSLERSWLLKACGWGCCIPGESVELRRSKFVAAVLLGPTGSSSGTPKEIISTMLDTSFATFSGTFCGSSLPTILRLQRYMARANSGNSNWPDLVVSERILALD